MVCRLASTACTMIIEASPHIVEASPYAIEVSPHGLDASPHSHEVPSIGPYILSCFDHFSLSSHIYKGRVTPLKSE